MPISTRDTFKIAGAVVLLSTAAGVVFGILGALAKRAVERMREDSRPELIILEGEG